MKKIFFILFSLMLLIIMFLLTMKLLGYSFNKNFLKEIYNFDKEQCVKKEYPTYEYHGGIAGCIFWSRHDYIETTQGWRLSFKRDDTYCDQKYNNSSLQKFTSIFNSEYNDPKCEYEAYRKQKREENWNYLVSDEQDNFYKNCTNEFCPWPSLFK